MTDSKNSTVIGRGIHIKGKVTGPAPIEVWGILEGQAGTEGVFTVRQGGKVKGDIAAANVVVEGEIEGKVTARERIKLESTCKVQGEITAEQIAMDPGAHFEGQVHMGKGGKK